MSTKSAAELDHKAELIKIHSNWSALSTRLGAERTMMATVRTSLSLIGFGFTIYKFFESLHTTPAGIRTLGAHAPRRLGFTLVALGVFVLVAGVYQHWFFLKELGKETGQAFPRSISLISAIILLFTGVVLLVTIVARL